MRAQLPGERATRRSRGGRGSAERRSGGSRPPADGWWRFGLSRGRLAWCLALFSEPSGRSYSEALVCARRGVELAPQKGNSHRALVLADIPITILDRLARVVRIR